ncbi:hypothetical protein H310_13613 [Aphanomyces invadans]|uniref:Uncharacterized protein n=1 Tax=Aphanomyces invadans TaxID=157072 RepID=A0A024TD54_9STRA|nr:hypothetical protein H310_13613 [Aphanomyces invadans]ETV91973.1 hypothetical protein H310_13613 [Aphanomyces invadans]|eukprot:XP_008879397.1 hypothetical protein H310_13613 [Aphanomyces invadans]
MGLSVGVMLEIALRYPSNVRRWVVRWHVGALQSRAQLATSGTPSKTPRTVCLSSHQRLVVAQQAARHRHSSTDVKTTSHCLSCGCCNSPQDGRGRRLSSARANVARSIDTSRRGSTELADIVGAASETRTMR